MIGKTILHYKILSKLGEGGMGVVYKAKDTKLDREVALKFLPQSQLGTGDDQKRFEQEAKAAAKLSHSNIATVFEINEHEGETFIAMEYVDGETLSDMVEKRPLKIKDAIKIARQIAEGLHSAHEQGIVHRDIKSANIMITAKGVVKIMDFGLAKLSKASMVTKAGTTLGTISYMSPEQTQGEKVDHRSDIWSLGVVLYEMVSGQMPFKGDYESAIMYSIMNEDPEPLTAVRTGVPMDLEKIVNKLLAKEPGERYQNIIELPVDLKAVNVDSTTTTINASTILDQGSGSLPRSRKTIPLNFAITMTACTAIICGLGVWLLTKSEPVVPHLRKVDINLRQNETLQIADPYAPTVSDDGEKVVFVARDQNDSWNLYLRELGATNTTVIAGTDGAGLPFFSPDGMWVGFYANGKIKKVLLSGGDPFVICELEVGFGGGTWGQDDTIVFGTLGSGLMSVSATGGQPHFLTKPDGVTSHRWPEFMPDRQSILFTIWPSRGSVLDFTEAKVAVFSLSSGVWHSIVGGGSNPRYGGNGYLFYTRNEGFMVAPIDDQKYELTGSPIPIFGEVEIALTGFANFDISSEGSLVYIDPFEPYQRMLIVDREGNLLTELMIQQSIETPRFSVSGDKIAYAKTNDEGEIQIWLYDLKSGTDSQLTDKGQNNYAPIWDNSGQRIIYNSRSAGINELYWKSADGISEEKLIWDKQPFLSPGSWSANGEYLAFYEINKGTSRDVGVLTLRDSTKQTIATTTANEAAPKFSPNGKWIAYSSNETGRQEVYVQPFPTTGEKFKISNGGGRTPVWSPDGSELFYLFEDKVMSVPIVADGGLRLGTYRKLFGGYEISGSYFRAEYDIHPRGDRFVLITREKKTPTDHINVILNWSEELRK